MERIHRIAFLCISIVSSAFWGRSSLAADAVPGPNYAHARELHSLMHWEHFPLRVYFVPGVTPERRDLALSGFDEWVHATRGIVCWQLVSAADQADLTVTFTSTSVVSGSPNIIGQTFVTSDDLVIHKATMLLSEQGDDAAEIKAMSAHEFGHALGIEGHSDNSDDMMYPIISWSLPSVWNAQHQFLDPPRTVTLRDVNTLKAAYPPSVFPPEKH